MVEPELLIGIIHIRFLEMNAEGDKGKITEKMEPEMEMNKLALLVGTNFLGQGCHSFLIMDKLLEPELPMLIRITINYRWVLLKKGWLDCKTG